MSTLTPDDPIERLVGRSAVYVRPDDTLLQVAETLDRENIGAVAVRGGDGISGIVSERDLVRAFAEGCDPVEDRAADVMTYAVEAVRPDETIGAVATRMLADGIRHVPVREGTVTLGVISIRDVLRVYVEGR